ncbi:hypothetical protein D0Q53_20735 [Salmonella enterica]|nr:hypothetical protein [Salmonella enterica]EJD1942448.1 hypothetical protein [Escherichia coli]EBL0923957.1 hypothetical protein [Salmonella enterica]ECO7324749.1 hypothetical protein [Salmonella enterica]EEK4464953.1 hypothetical protein [Salmonella enterica]
MKTAIIALSIVLASISAAHAGSAIAMKCPTSGAVIVDTGDGDSTLTITQNDVAYTITERTIRTTDHGKLVTIQGAALASDTSKWRAVIVSEDFEKYGVLYLVRSDAKVKERCTVTDMNNY